MFFHRWEWVINYLEQKAGYVGATALNELLNDVKANYGMLLIILITYLVEL